MTSDPSRKTGSQERHSDALSFALDVVETLAESGLITLPIEPTSAMLEAGAKAGDTTLDKVSEIYHAMIVAS